MKLLTSLIFVLFFNNALAETGHPYDPMIEGSSITYSVFAMTGTYDDQTMRITPVTNTPAGTVKITFSKNQYSDSYLPLQDLFVRYYHAVGSSPTPVNFSSAVQDAKWMTINNQQFIGEAVNELGNTIIPPEPKLQRNLVAGTLIEGFSIVRKSASDNTIINSAFKWKYRTIEYLPTAWGSFVDCWRTGLREYIPTSKDRVYNYLFMKDKGMVNFWYGDLNADGTVTGYQFYATQY